MAEYPSLNEAIELLASRFEVIPDSWLFLKGASIPAACLGPHAIAIAR
jgi:hypothetical protein